MKLVPSTNHPPNPVTIYVDITDGDTMQFHAGAIRVASPPAKAH